VVRQIICLAMESERLSVSYLSDSEIDPHIYGICRYILRGDIVRDIALSRNQRVVDGMKTKISSGIADTSPMALQAVFRILSHRARL
jgi:hypothetical protein